MSWTALGTTLGCHHSAGISRRVLSSAQNCCTVPVAAAKTQVLPATALATAGGFPIQERRKLSGIGHSCLRHVIRATMFSIMKPRTFWVTALLAGLSLLL